MMDEGTATAATALLEHLCRRIRFEGPLTVAAFMAEALGNPRWGYYMTADRFGAAGDFVTAPEISQMFGELIGLWGLDTWWRATGGRGAVAPPLLVELGPGRGTLMADALRAISAVAPDFAAGLACHLVETSPVLRERQAATLAAAPGSALRPTPVWHDSLATVPEGPALYLANEFFDALPVRQFQKTERGWAERLVDVEPEAPADSADPRAPALRFVLERPGGVSTRMVPAAWDAVPVGTVVDLALASASLAHEVGRRVARSGGAALIIDYGHTEPVPLDTLQAVRRHTPVPVLSDPGQADLTTHVDFGALAAAAAVGGNAAAAESGVVAHGPVTQGDFLRALGIEARAAALRRCATLEQANAVGAALTRLTRSEPEAMGSLFKVLALTRRDAPIPAGFEAT